MSYLKAFSIEDLPKPNNDNLGFPFTEYIPPQYVGENLPKISIITPSYNQGQFIEQTIRSVLLQGYPNLEYIIIDGGSTDNTVEIIKKYEKWITYWVSEPDNGQSHAINKGLAKVTGEVFNWLNSDDYYLPNALLNIGQFFLKQPKTNVLCGYERHLLSNNAFKVQLFTTPILSTAEQMIAYNHIAQPPTFFRVSVIQELGFLNEQLHFCMDADLWIRYLMKYGKEGIYSTTDLFNVFRYHEVSKSVQSRDIYLKDRYSLMLSVLDSCPNDDFPRSFQKDAPFFEPYFQYKYPLSINLNPSKIQAYVAVRLIVFFKKNLSWASFWEIYFYTLKKKAFGLSWLFYLSPILKLRQHLIQRVK